MKNRHMKQETRYMTQDKRYKTQEMCRVSGFMLLVSCILLLVFLTATPAFAAEIFLEPDKSAGQEDEFKVSLFLSAEDKLNAIEGTLNFSPNLLKLKSIEDGNSIINFWVEHPTIISNNGIRFAGITPGGYKGEQGLIFSATFKILQEGNGVFDIEDARAFLNDGMGTEAKIQIIDSPFVISEKSVDFQLPVSDIKDEVAPESFRPEVANDLVVFDGKWFLVFSTQDKATGIDHYEIKEVRQDILQILVPWIRAESPYVLGDQELRSHIFVKAVDKSGNAKIEEISAKNPLPWYEYYENWFIIMILVVGVVYLLLNIWRRNF